jgi:hypothetical protein
MPFDNPTICPLHIMFRILNPILSRSTGQIPTGNILFLRETGEGFNVRGPCSDRPRFRNVPAPSRRL